MIIPYCFSMQKKTMSSNGFQPPQVCLCLNYSEKVWMEKNEICTFFYPAVMNMKSKLKTFDYFFPEQNIM